MTNTNEKREEQEVKEVKEDSKMEVVDNSHKNELLSPFHSLFNDDWFLPQFRHNFGLLVPEFDFEMKELRKMPKANLVEKDNTYELTVELPGFTKDEVDVVVTDNTITITAEKLSTKDEKEEKHILKERTSSIIKRSFRFPGVTKKDVKAKLTDGILEVTIQKTKDEKKELEKVEIE